MKSDLSADQHRVAATGSTAFAMENAALRAEIERLRAALEPFARFAKARDEHWGPSTSDDTDMLCNSVGDVKLTFGDLRRARNVLT